MELKYRLRSELLGGTATPGNGGRDGIRCYVSKDEMINRRFNVANCGHVSSVLQGIPDLSRIYDKLY